MHVFSYRRTVKTYTSENSTGVTNMDLLWILFMLMVVSISVRGSVPPVAKSRVTILFLFPFFLSSRLLEVSNVYSILRGDVSGWEIWKHRLIAVSPFYRPTAATAEAQPTLLSIKSLSVISQQVGLTSTVSTLGKKD